MIDTNNTKEKILNAAEKVFVEKGYDGASVRAITHAADVNLSLVNYHFRNKELLFNTVVSRLIYQFTDFFYENIENAKRTKRAEERVCSLSIKEILKIFVETIFSLADQSQNSQYFIRFMLHFSSTPEDWILHRFHCQSKSLFYPLFKEFQQALKQFSEEATYWRFQFVLGALGKIICPIPISGDEDPAPYGQDRERAIEELLGLMSWD